MAKQPNSVPDYLLAGVEEIEKADGFISINEICKNLGISQRQFSRQFSQIVGLSPKYFARVLQMNKALQALLSKDQNYLSDIAVQTGYYDESHLIHAIQHFFNLNTNELLNSEQETLFTFLGKSRNWQKNKS